jgi:hypothetical protein
MTHERTTELPRDLLDRLRNVELLVKRCADPVRGKANRSALAQIGAALALDRDTLAEKLARGDRWLTNHPAAPDYDEREVMWLHWLDQYCAIEDTLASARGAL